MNNKQIVDTKYLAQRMIPFGKITEMDRKGYKDFYELLVHRVLKWKWRKVANIDFIYIDIPERFCK